MTLDVKDENVGESEANSNAFEVYSRRLLLDANADLGFEQDYCKYEKKNILLMISFYHLNETAQMKLFNVRDLPFSINGLMKYF